MPSYIRVDKSKNKKGGKMNQNNQPYQKQNPYYPNPINDPSMNSCCGNQKCGCKTNQPFSSRPFFPDYFGGQNNMDNRQNNGQNYGNQSYTQNYDQNAYNQNYFGGQNNQNYNQNFNGQNGQNYNQNFGGQNGQNYNQNFAGGNQGFEPNYQGYSNEQNYPQATPPKQKNLFGSLNPEQLMSMFSSKGNLSSLLGSMGSSNPQLGMLMGLMQNMPKAKKQTVAQEEKTQEKEKKYIKVKDYYKENSDENK